MSRNIEMFNPDLPVGVSPFGNASVPGMTPEPALSETNGTSSYNSPQTPVNRSDAYRGDYPGSDGYQLWPLPQNPHSYPKGTSSGHQIPDGVSRVGNPGDTGASLAQSRPIRDDQLVRRSSYSPRADHNRNDNIHHPSYSSGGRVAQGSERGQAPLQALSYPPLGPPGTMKGFHHSTPTEMCKFHLIPLA
jgi:hypothetical protein